MTEPTWTSRDGRAVLYCGDALATLREMPDESVNCIVTSPPYWGLRDYHVVEQIGLESSPEAYVAGMVAVFREARRVLRKDGTVFLNIGDCYTGSSKGGNPEEGEQASNKGSRTIGALYGKTGESARQASVTNLSRRLCAEQGLAPKNLIGIPWRVAFALQDDGWYLRSDIIWAKPNPMPESVCDRPTRSHEYIFLLTKNAKYWYDAEAIKEQGSFWHGDQVGGLKTISVHHSPGGCRPDKQRGHSRRHDGFNDRWDQMTKEEQCSIGRNKRDVWTVATEPFGGAHFAVFPQKLIEPCILAGCSSGGVVLDPFAGSGTTCLVALRLARRAILIELNPDYCTMARSRIEPVADQTDLLKGL